MSFKTSFTFRDQFRTILDAGIEKTGLSQTRLIEEAVEQYEKGALPESEITTRLDELVTKNTELQNILITEIRKINGSIDGLDTLVKQVLKNQQSGDNSGK